MPIALPVPLSDLATTGHQQTDFMSLYPRLQHHAQIRFRHLPKVEREEAMAEMMAASWENYTRLVERQQLHRAYFCSLSSFAARHVQQDRHVGGRQRSKDAFSPMAQSKRGFSVDSLDRDTPDGWRTLAVEDRRTGPAEVAAFRLDFQAWRSQLPRRYHRIMDGLARGDRLSDIAAKMGLSCGRISQLRRSWAESWARFQASPEV